MRWLASMLVADWRADRCGRLYGARVGQADADAAPIYGIKIPQGYRDWQLISANHLMGGNLKQVRAQLGNEIAMKAFREGKLPFPDGAIIAALHWKEVTSDENNKLLADSFSPPASNRGSPDPS